MQRRDFLKGACRICALGAAGGSVIAGVASCSPSIGKNSFKPVIKDNQVEVPLSLFDSQAFQVVSPEKYQYEIAVEKKAAGIYTALLLRCTHYQNQLTPTGNGFTCPAHGSRFDKEGNVLRGPAETALQHLNTQIIKNNLLIHL